MYELKEEEKNFEVIDPDTCRKISCVVGMENYNYRYGPKTMITFLENYGSDINNVIVLPHPDGWPQGFKVEIGTKTEAVALMKSFKWAAEKIEQFLNEYGIEVNT